MIHVIHFRAAECIEPSKAIERLDMLIEGARNAVLGHQFADRASLAFGTRPVVAPDVEDQGVLFRAELVETRRSACRPERQHAR